MRGSRLAAAVLLGLAALFLAAAARDAVDRRSTLAAGDARARSEPAQASWRASAWLPGDPIRRLLALDDDLALREALRAFLVAEATPRGFDNGEMKARVRAGAETALSDIAAHASPTRASQASDLLGVLVASAGRVSGGVTADDRARDAFEAAVRADPENLDAKYNLELLLRRTKATSSRTGPGTGSGSRGQGRRGAGSGTPGRGY